MLGRQPPYDPPLRFAEQISSGIDTDVQTAIQKSLAFMGSIQHAPGCWEAEVVWCPMLSAQYVMTAHLMGRPLSEERSAKIQRYFDVWQLDDGGWGMHAESPSYLFVTTLVYVAMRLSGIPADDPRLVRARNFIESQGGPLGIPSWGKLWLALFNLYDWSGVNPILPELWLLPDSHFAHPRRYYCHTRLIYLPIGVLYGLRFQCTVDATIEAIRSELYSLPYDTIPFAKHRNHMVERDMFAWPTIPIKAAYRASIWVDKLAPDALRRRAIAHCNDHIREHLRASRYASISPVNGLLNCIALWAQDPDDKDAHLSFDGSDYWIWEDEYEGIRFNGARSQTWDTAFAVQALDATGDALKDLNPLHHAARYLNEHQMRDELRERKTYYRDRLRGGFCFSDKHHRWPVSDCTGEALAAMEAIGRRTGNHFSFAQVREAVEFVLTRQNSDGGWGSYERNRGNLILEKLNPSEMFGNCMVEHSYVECTASCIRGLVAARHAAPDLPPSLLSKMRQAIKKGARLLLRAQQSDGSWPGFWGVNYTYGTLFGIQGLIDAGYSTQSNPIVAARNWLCKTQLRDGGWGERWESCVEERYMPSEHSQVIMTAWALMGLICAGERRASILEPAIRVLTQRQLDNGDWPKEGVGGVFFNTAMHHYMLYKSYFPLWALGMAQQQILSGKQES